MTDGTSNTLLLGEKHVQKGQFGKPNLDCSIYNAANIICSCRGAGPDYPLAVSVNDTLAKFGSYHPGRCQFVFADGSVHNLLTSLDPQILGHLANISDGNAIPGFEF